MNKFSRINMAAPRIVAFHNVHIPGIIPTLWTFLRLEQFNGRVQSAVMGRKRDARKLKVGFHIDVVSETSTGLQLVARNGRKVQEVSSVPNLYCMEYIVLLSLSQTCTHYLDTLLLVLVSCADNACDLRSKVGGAECT